MGVSLTSQFKISCANKARITRLMGESFRLHSQALVGYVDDIAISSSVSTPSMTSQGADEDSVY